MTRRRNSRPRRRGKPSAGSTADPRPLGPDWTAGLLGTALVLAPIAVAWWLQAGDEQRYYLTTQEDGFVEWATFWAFLLVLPASIFIARDLHRRRQIPWFPIGVGLFCLFVALEEISWGQRLLGYRPPDYFLAENFQQELNFHNVVDTSNRKLALKAVILGYGVLLPLAAAAFRRVGRVFTSLGIVAPPAALAPAFLVIFAVYEAYPWNHTGEWIELALGLGFLGASVMRQPSFGKSSWCARLSRPRLALPVAWLATLVLGAGTAFGYHALRDPDPLKIQQALRELAELRRDFSSGLVDSDCNVHKRLYTFVKELGQNSLLEGSFARLTEQWLPPERSRFLLDPWNSPYWVRDRCQGDRRIAFVYSLGPNRRRDSSRTEILGDDLGAVFFEGPEDGGAPNDDSDAGDRATAAPRLP